MTLTRAILTLLAVCAAPAGESVVFIDAGRPKLVAYQRTPWVHGGTYMQGRGNVDELYAGKTIGPGDFRIRARLRIARLHRSRASFKLGRSYFGFEGRKRQTYTTGPMFGGKQRNLGPSRKFVRTGTWFDFEVERKGRAIALRIDGKPVHQVQYSSGAIGRIGCFPGLSFMQVQHFSAEGTMSDVSAMPKGYTIPTIDLALEGERQTIVDREQGQYLGHPTTVLIEDNRTMVCVYPKGHGKGAIVMKRSTDAGLTWSERLPTPKSWETSRETPTIYCVADPQDRKRLIMFSGLYPIRMAVSEDDGATWSELEPIGDFGGIVAMADLLRLKDGSYLAVFHDHGRFLRKGGKRTERRTVYRTLSKDGGLTWSQPEVVVCVPEAGLCEPGLIRSPDGNQIAMLLRESHRTFNSFVTFSNDEGQTWTDPRELPASLTGDRHQLIYTPDGRLFASFRDTTHQSPTKGDWVGWVGTYEDLVEGREGQYRVRLMDHTKGSDCAYPAIELLPDGTIVCTTYGHWTKDEEPYIVSVRFKMEELDHRLPPNAVDLFFNGLDGVAQYRIPSLVVTTKGTLIAVCDARVDRPGDLPNNIDIAMRRSFDHGQTWTPVERIVDFPDAEGASDPCLLVDRDTGTVWMFYDHGVPHPTLPLKRKVTLHVIKSDDDGATWSAPRDLGADLCKPEWYYIASAPGNGIQLRGGRLIAPVYIPHHDGHRTCHALYSDDHGQTWNLGEGTTNNATGEPQIVELADGALMMNVRRPPKADCRGVAISKDAGLTWSEVVNDPHLIEPSCQASFVRYTCTTGGDDRNRLLFCNPGNTGRRAGMTVRVSYDEGKTWAAHRGIHPTYSSYSSLAVLPDKSIGLLYERDPKFTLTFATFTLDWLTKGKDKLGE